MTLLWKISLLECGLSGPWSLCGLSALKQPQLQGSASWRITDFTPEEVSDCSPCSCESWHISIGHGSICYRDTMQKASSEGRQISLIKSQKHLQFINGLILNLALQVMLR